jgi:hypothetical protein
MSITWSTGHTGWLAMKSRPSGPAAEVLPSVSKPLRR